jgi:hydroxymethylglutaryl-CoA reductase
MLQVLASVGLAQNFAAIRALAVEGIQKGHMALHARNVAASAGVPQDRIVEVVSLMVKSDKVNLLFVFVFLPSLRLGF